MNYRHAFHAGNHADVLKHIVLTRVIERLKQKEKPFRFLDAHGGIGTYDLAGVEAEKTFEWRDGVGLLFAADGAPIALGEDVETLIAPWRNCVTALNEKGALRHYPGSPGVARSLLRSADLIRLNELHPVDFETLSQRYAGDKRASVTHLDALVFIKSQLPPPERRGLIFVDPPYEKTDEADHALRMVTEGLKRFATGVFALWYPVTGDGLDCKIKNAIAAMPVAALTAEMRVREERRNGGLAGSGVIVVNPPWRLNEDVEQILPALADRLSQGAPRFAIDYRGD